MRPMKTTAMSSLQKGFSLIELMVALLVMVVISTAVMRSLSGLQDPSFYQQTADRVQAIKDAIIKVQTVNGIPTVSGFVADMGRLPNNLRELLDNSAGNPVWATGACSVAGYTDQLSCTGTWTPYPGNIGIGWRGPYIQTSKSPSQPDAFTDGWGRDYQEPGTAQGSCPSQHWLLDMDNTARCHVDDLSNYGWRSDNRVPSDPSLAQTGTNTNLLNLQSYGSDGIPDSIRTPTDLYQPDYPASQPVIQQQGWQFNLGSIIGGNLSPTSITINMRASGVAFISISGNSALCGMAAGIMNVTNCNVTQDMCSILNGIWTSSSSSCTFTAMPLQSLCTNSGGSWDGTSKCTIVMDQITCSTLNGSYSSPQCTQTAASYSSAPTLNDTCINLLGGSTPLCTFTGSTTISIAGLCKTFGGAWNNSNSVCTVGAPLLLGLSQTCTSGSYIEQSSLCQMLKTQSICLNVFYRYTSTSPPYAQIAVATAPATVSSDGQLHALGFQGFSVYDLSGTQLINNLSAQNPVAIPAGQNAISVTQANSDGTCTGTPWNNAPYPANHPSTPVLQTFLPSLPLIFNW